MKLLYPENNVFYLKTLKKIVSLNFSTYNERIFFYMHSNFYKF